MSDAPIKLSGITWNHTRGYLPMVATAQRWTEQYPNVEITWQKRSLQEFADYPIERLVERFDLLVIDHPFAGQAAQMDVLLPIDAYLPAAFLADQAANSVGASHPSYAFGEHQWALAIDAATPVSSHRPDLLERYGTSVPQTWTELIELARTGRVAIPAIPIDSLMNWYMLCLALGGDLFGSEGPLVARDVGIAALQHLRELVTLCDPACLRRNPIATYEAMTTGDDLVYCPFAYGYSNYGRADYTDRPLRFGGLVRWNDRPMRSTLGGTGLAVSRHTKHAEQAMAYAAFVASPATQRGLFTTSGGQPGHRAAWLDPTLNVASNDFFRATLPTLDDAYLRPRYAGYLHFQDEAGPVIHRYLESGGDEGAVLDRLEALYLHHR